MATSSALAAAAQTLETELVRFEELTEALQREKLNSEKGIRRAGQRLEAIAECERRMATHLQTLVGAIAAVSERQQAQAIAVQKYATVLQQRAEALASLRAKGEVLREEAARIHTAARELFGEGEVEVVGVDPRHGIDAIGQAIEKLAEGARELSQAAEGQGFVEMARDGESLRLQLLATHNRLDLLASKTA